MLFIRTHFSQIIIILLGTLLLILSAVAILSFMHSPQKKNLDSYHIQNMPYVGIHNNIDKFRQPYSRNSVSAAVIEVIGYWYPEEVNPAEIDNLFEDYNRPVTTDSVETYLQVTDIYRKIQIKEIETDIDGLATLLNSKAKTPLILSVPLLVSDEFKYTVAMVLTGINYEKKTLTFDSYWLGADYEVSFEEFEVMQQQLAPEERYSFVMIKPISEVYALDLEPVTEPYNRVSLSDIEIQIFTHYALAEAAVRSSEFTFALSEYQKATDMAEFDELIAPSFKVIILSRMAEVLFQLGRHNEAITLVEEKILPINHSLTAPFKHLGSYDYMFTNNAEGHRDELSLPYIIIGDAYRFLGEKDKAIESYTKALEIYPNHVGPKNKLRELQKSDA